ncbi:exonuclease SbcCD subunit D [Pelagicoccus albus]|uniref:Nuclease SbcCD subunit D n=1 Tax=Pelagicoccus albus TaxID=415222 RepID=A0A7X1B5H9_9BACT|nr:exonuclease SbcCD subunit D [Pelagicoccus albus]MBC2604933.1 exonuclease SbcCD subunit D [Pelagicoccus albus]
MKFLHTADWHLGRIFHQLHLTDDQAVALDQIVDIAVAEKVDAVIVAGDLYDRAVPPPEAVALLDRTWARLISETGAPIIAIPGNHDSATRVGYGASLLAKSGLHIVANFEEAIQPIQVGGIDVFALPFAEPAEVRAWAGASEVRDHATAMQVCLDRMRENFSPDRRRMLVAHAFVAGAKTESESERPLSVGGAGTVPYELFKDFDYVALGHLHAPQTIAPNCLYSGSPLKYSFSEASHKKSVVIGEMDPVSGDINVRLVPLKPRRDVRNLEGELLKLISGASNDPKRLDYLRVTLTDQGALLNAISRLREVYPNVLQIERTYLQKTSASQIQKRRESTETELFSNFYREALDGEPSPEELSLFQQAINELNRSEPLSEGASL